MRCLTNRNAVQLHSPGLASTAAAVDANPGATTCNLPRPQRGRTKMRYPKTRPRQSRSIYSADVRDTTCDDGANSVLSHPFRMPPPFSIASPGCAALRGDPWAALCHHFVVKTCAIDEPSQMSRLRCETPSTWHGERTVPRPFFGSVPHAKTPAFLGISGTARNGSAKQNTVLSPCHLRRRESHDKKTIPDQTAQLQNLRLRVKRGRYGQVRCAVK